MLVVQYHKVKDIDMPEGMQIIDIVTDEFILDNGKVVQDPVGSLSSSFTVKAQVVLANREYMKQLSNIFRKADIDIDGLVPVNACRKKLGIRW